MLEARPIPERDPVLLTGAPTAAEIAAGGEGVRVDAVLGVEGRDVVVQGNGEARGRRIREQSEQLGLVEVMRAGERIQPQREQVVGGEAVGRSEEHTSELQSRE